MAHRGQRPDLADVYWYGTSGDLVCWLPALAAEADGLASASRPAPDHGGLLRRVLRLDHRVAVDASPSAPLGWRVSGRSSRAPRADQRLILFPAQDVTRPYPFHRALAGASLGRPAVGRGGLAPPPPLRMVPEPPFSGGPSAGICLGVEEASCSTGRGGCLFSASPVRRGRSMSRRCFTARPFRGLSGRDLCWANGYAFDFCTETTSSSARSFLSFSARRA